MTDRLDPGGGGLTGATGDLTPDASADPFEPGERREIDDAAQRGLVTHEQAIRGPGTAGPATDDDRPQREPRESRLGGDETIAAEDDRF